MAAAAAAAAAVVQVLRMLRKHGLVDGGMRKSRNLMAGLLDDGDEAGADVDQLRQPESGSRSR